MRTHREVPPDGTRYDAFNRDVGERIQALRLARNETQAELAALLQDNKANVAHLETGRNTLTLRKAILLCQHFRISLDELVGMEDEAHTDWLRLKTLASSLSPQKLVLLEQLIAMLHEWDTAPRFAPTLAISDEPTTPSGIR